MLLAIILLVSLAGVIGYELLFREKNLYARYKNYRGAYRLWIKKYGSSARPEIKEFLRLFGACYYVDPSYLDCLRPDEPVKTFYKLDYRPNEGDFFENETFFDMIRLNYHYTLTEEDMNQPLSELFEKICISKRQNIMPNKSL